MEGFGRDGDGDGRREGGDDNGIMGEGMNEGMGG